MAVELIVRKTPKWLPSSGPPELTANSLLEFFITTVQKIHDDLDSGTTISYLQHLKARKGTAPKFGNFTKTFKEDVTKMIKQSQTNMALALFQHGS